MRRNKRRSRKKATGRNGNGNSVGRAIKGEFHTEIIANFDRSDFLCSLNNPRTLHFRQEN